ncbi:MAG TPA: glutaredoxin [Propionibacteriaceae bacterium]|nr:glutaredoxin [Propionibacteriaceae bacterium]
MSDRRSLRVTVVTAPGCHFCEDAHRELAELVDGGAAIELDVVEATSETGSHLLRTHRPAMNPLVLVDGAYFSAGRFPRRKFHALLTAGTQEVRHG